MGENMTYSKESLEKMLRIWQTHSKEPLILEDAQETAENAFTLIKLDKKYGPPAK
jgi:hypothetical protein